MDFLKNLSKRERALLIVASSCITLAIVYRLVMIPVRDSNNRMDADIAQLSTQLEILQTVASLKDGVDAEYVRFKQTFAGTGTEKEQMSALQATLDKLTSESGVLLSVVKPRKVKTTEWSKTFFVEVQIEGKASELMAFLYDLNNAEGAYRVDSLQLARKEKKANILKASLLVSKLCFADNLAAN